MSTLTYSPSVGQITNKKTFSIDDPLILIMKVKAHNPNAGKLAPIFGPLGITPKSMTQRIQEFVQASNWTAKHITLRITIKQRDIIDLELSEHSAGLIIANLGESPSAQQHNVVHDGNLTFDQLILIAQTKTSSRTARTLTSKVKEVLGTCISVGCKVNGEDPRVLLLQINNGTLPYKIPEPKE